VQATPPQPDIQPVVSLHKTVVSNPPTPVSKPIQQLSAAQAPEDKSQYSHRSLVGNALQVDVAPPSSSSEEAR